MTPIYAAILRLRAGAAALWGRLTGAEARALRGWVGIIDEQVLELRRWRQATDTKIAGLDSPISGPWAAANRAHSKTHDVAIELERFAKATRDGLEALRALIDDLELRSTNQSRDLGQLEANVLASGQQLSHISAQLERIATVLEQQPAPPRAEAWVALDEDLDGTENQPTTPGDPA